MAIAKNDILEAIASMSVMEVVDLIEAMEEKFNVSAASFAMPVAAAGAHLLLLQKKKLNSTLL